MSRLALIVSFAILLIVAGVLASIPFLVRDRAPEVGANETVAFSSEFGRIRVAGDIEFVGPDVVRILLAPGAGGTRATPVLNLDMPEHAMQALLPPVEQLPDGRFEAVATLPMSGYWRLRIELPEGWIDAGFRLPK